MASGTVLRLKESASAWNVDGSSDALSQSGSWIREAENATGRRRGRCSFQGCGNPAEVGGHVYMARVGCVIAPICKHCNLPSHQGRMQGAGARLRANIEVTRTFMTSGMRTAARRVPGLAPAIRKRQRRCVSCNDDISSRPAGHALCYRCWTSGRRASRKDEEDEGDEGDEEDEEDEEM